MYRPLFKKQLPKEFQKNYDKCVQYIEDIIEKNPDEEILYIPIQTYSDSIFRSLDPSEASDEKLTEIGIDPKYTFKHLNRSILTDDAPVEIKKLWSILKTKTSETYDVFLKNIADKFKGRVLVGPQRSNIKRLKGVPQNFYSNMFSIVYLEIYVHL